MDQREDRVMQEIDPTTSLHVELMDGLEEPSNLGGDIMHQRDTALLYGQSQQHLRAMCNVTYQIPIFIPLEISITSLLVQAHVCREVTRWMRGEREADVPWSHRTSSMRDLPNIDPLNRLLMLDIERSTWSMGYHEYNMPL